MSSFCAPADSLAPRSSQFDTASCSLRVPCPLAPCCLSESPRGLTQLDCVSKSALRGTSAAQAVGSEAGYGRCSALEPHVGDALSRRVLPALEWQRPCTGLLEDCVS